MKERTGSALLLLTAVIWGGAFVAQSVGMDYIGPLTFQAMRSLLGVLSLLPIILWRRRGKAADAAPGTRDRRTLVTGGILCGIVLCVAAGLQQVGLVYVSAGKAGFLTTLYILIVPILGIFRGKRVPRLLWGCIALALAGLYLLTVTERFTVSLPDLYLVVCSIIYSVHILLVDYYSPRVDCVELSCMQFLVAGLLYLAAMFLWETPRADAILSAWAPLLYTGILSSAVAFTLQIVGQKSTSPAVASMLMSLESVFAVIAGMLLLGQVPSSREIAGSALMFLAITAAQLVQLPAGAVFRGRGSVQNDAL